MALQYSDALRLMDERFGHDALIALATVENGRPAVRTVNAFYENGAFYVITHALSNKMRQLRENPAAAVCGDWFTGSGVGETLGHPCAPENAEILSKLRAVFAEWYSNGHVDESDPNTCILRIRLTEGLLLSHGDRCAIDFAAGRLKGEAAEPAPTEGSAPVPAVPTLEPLKRKVRGSMWAYDSVFYQIYPLGFCGAPRENTGESASRIGKLAEWGEHIQRLGADALYLCPLFESDAHGYDTRDYRLIDRRLGTNEEFAAVCRSLHQQGIAIVLDGVFNHVGRGFWAFQDVLKNRESSPYKDWFFINFGGNNGYQDGLWYEGWEGHYELVRLNLKNEAVIEHLFSCIRSWVEQFDIDGLRLDVAYCLDKDFLRRLRGFCDSLKPGFFLVGEVLHGDYNPFLQEGMLHSVTNYECYKGLYSSFNSLNLFEITHSLLRQFGPENWTLYKGRHLLCFVDNHDVTRIASMLQEPRHLPLIYALLFGMPGIPCIYYGSEWGQPGRKEEGDFALRPCPEGPQWNALTGTIAAYARAHRESGALCHGDFHSLLLQNKQVVFERAYNGERVLVAINADSAPFTAHFNANAGRARDLLTGQLHDFGGGSVLPPYSAAYWQVC